MSLLITSLLMSLIAALWVWVTGRKDPCGRPWLTALCLGLLLVLPLLALLPKVQIVMPRAEDAVANLSSWGMTGLLPIAWAAMALLMLLRLVRHHIALHRWLEQSDDVDPQDWKPVLAECAELLGLTKLPEMKIKSGLSSPVVARLFRPVILLPTCARDWSDETRKMAILHELGHLRRRDLWFRLAAEIACALHWYNPLVWWLRGKFLTQCEYACDALVVSAGADRKSYISALCDVVETAMAEARPPGAMAMADHAPLKLRVNRLLGGGRSGSSLLAITAAILTTSTALGLSLLRPADVLEPLQEIGGYTPEEIDLRHSANPFPGE